jgi:hypothetical protein
VTRIEWLNWRLRWSGQKTRLRDLSFFLKFEVYNLVCWLSRYKISHWLKREPPGGEGKYLRVRRPAPFLVRQLDRVFVFGEEAHCYYLPYSPETAAELRLSGEQVQEVEVKCELRMFLA